MTTTARWENNTLMVRWYGGRYEDDAAIIRRTPDGNFIMESDGYDELFCKIYTSKPTAEDALADIINWQNYN